MKFTYSCGDTPLAGYTIKRGVGKGGFGEVYYGLSDGGKEVALKLIRTNSDVELRGINQCLNLKHPNLVHLYDLRTDAVGERWLVMEYIEGESLGNILQRNPHGIAPELASAWFQGLSAGIQHLHEHGIVHRDLKPGNIFLEKGTVKVGDYGLCKLMGSQRAGQTQSVGTVHYMAPEISTGNYNRQVDVYACGVMLFEMLTGKVPFDGETAGEILMKHLTSPPDLTGVPGPYMPILDKALCKNPARRFQTLGEMSKKIAELQHKQTEPVALAPVQPLPALRKDLPVTAPLPSAETPRPAGADLSGSLLFAALLAALFSLIWTAALGDSDWQSLARLYFLTTAGAWAVLTVNKRLTERKDESTSRRLVFLGVGLVLGSLALWLDGYRVPGPWNETPASNALRRFESVGTQRHPFFDALYPDNQTMPIVGCYLTYFGLMFFALRWWKLTELNRNQRFHFQGVLTTAFWAYVLLFLLPSAPERQVGFAALVLTSAVVQIASPWEQVVAVRSKKLRLRLA